MPGRSAYRSALGCALADRRASLVKQARLTPPPGGGKEMEEIAFESEWGLEPQTCSLRALRAWTLSVPGVSHVLCERNGRSYPLSATASSSIGQCTFRAHSGTDLRSSRSVSDGRRASNPKGASGNACDGTG
jgi:hypothetical protein